MLAHLIPISDLFDETSPHLCPHDTSLSTTFGFDLFVSFCVHSSTLYPFCHFILSVSIFFFRCASRHRGCSLMSSPLRYQMPRNNAMFTESSIGNLTLGKIILQQNKKIKVKVKVKDRP